MSIEAPGKKSLPSWMNKFSWREWKGFFTWTKKEWRWMAVFASRRVKYLIVMSVRRKYIIEGWKCLLPNTSRKFRLSQRNRVVKCGDGCADAVAHMPTCREERRACFSD
jgi:hypothetical protein